METENNMNDLRVASFSCYLKPIEGMVNMFDASENMAVLDLKPSMLTPSRTLSVRSETRSNDNRWFYGCKGPCSTKKDIYVQKSIKKVDQFTFPVMDILTNKQQKVEELPTMSIEVFGSGTINKGDIEKTLARKMSILTWDAIPKSKESVVCDDMMSEASSDLFELENVSSYQSCSTRCAPGEGSIEWSVYADCSEEKQTVRAKTQKNSRKKLDNGLLGCNGFKSVKVVEPVYRTTDKSKIRYI